MLLWNDINIHMKIYTEIPGKLPHRAHAVQKLHRKVLKCLSYCQTSHHFQEEYRHKGRTVYAHNIENKENVAGI